MARSISINIIGGGNLAYHLIKEFLKHPEIHLNQLYARNLNQLKDFEGTAVLINDLHLLTPADLSIIAVSDDAIGEVSGQLKHYHSLIVHTSGTQPMEVLQCPRKGVFYPFQSFSKNKSTIDFKEVPLLIEAQNEKDLKKLVFLAKLLSSKVYEMTSRQRSALHLAGVFAANFSNHMYVLADEILKENQIPFELIIPLIQEVAHKINLLSPTEAQTGPAVREDHKTINKHLEMLEGDKKRIYNLLTESIIKTKNK